MLITHFPTLLLVGALLPQSSAGECQPSCLPLSAHSAPGPPVSRMAVGGAVGSIVGVGLGLLVAGPQRCDSEDTACIVSRLGYAGIFTVAGAAGGAVVAGRRSGGDPSELGAILGATVGALAGVGVWKLFDELGSGGGGVSAIFVFAIPQGLLAAVAARLLAGP